MLRPRHGWTARHANREGRAPCGRLAARAARLEGHRRALSGSKDGELRRHQYHPGKPAAHAARGDFHLLHHLGDGKSERRRAVQDDARQAGAARILGIGVDRVPDARALGVDVRCGCGDADFTDFLQSLAGKRIFDRLDGPIAAVERDTAVEHAVVAGAHVVAAGAARLHAHHHKGARAALRHGDHLAGNAEHFFPYRSMEGYIVLCVHQPCVERLQAGHLAQHGVRRPFVADRKQRMRRRAHFAERGVVGHQPALVDRDRSGGRLAGDARADLHAPMCTTISRREPRRRCSHR